MVYKLVKVSVISISEPGKSINEDLVNFTKNAVWVMDGATGLWDRNVTGKDDAEWFVKKFDEYLQEHIHDKIPFVK